MIFTRFFVLIAMAFAVCAPGFASPDGKRIVDLATHQEMIIYAIAADYAMVGLGVDYHNPKDDIAKRIAKYEKNSAELVKLAASAWPAAKQQQLKKAWAEIKATVSAKPDIHAARALYEHAKSLEKEHEALAEAQSKKDHQAKEEIYVLVGELGMEGQRLTALYMMKIWDTADAAVFKQEIHEVFKEVKTIFGRLDKLQESDPKAKGMIQKIEKDVMLLEHLVDSDKNYPVLIEKSTEKLMDEVEELLTYVSAFISWLYGSYASV